MNTWWAAQSCGQIVFEAARMASRQGEEVRCNFVLMDCEVFVRPLSELSPCPTYFWLGADGE
jgi:hypothetical protein